MTPSTWEETLNTYPEMTPQEVDDTFATAHEALNTWRNLPFAERAALLSGAAELCRKCPQELASLMALGMGDLITDARPEWTLSSRVDPLLEIE